MDKDAVVETFKADLGKLRTGRAHTGLLDHSRSTTTARTSRSTRSRTSTLADARTIAVTPWEKKMVPAIEKAILESDLGLNPRPRAT